jgi:catechol 2,3-dioxygenase-like lactoylglutathione lyase family enzyme
MARARRSISTYGLTHIALSVKDPPRAFEFYRAVFGMVAVYRHRNFIQAQTPGARDVIVLERSRRGTDRRPHVLRCGPSFCRDTDGDAPVLRAALSRVVVRDRMLAAVPFRGKPARIDAHPLQLVPDRLGPHL